MPRFRPRRRHWVADADRCRIEARMCAAALVDHLHRCGICCSRLPPATPPELHQTCTAYGQKWACGRIAAEWLKEHLHGRQVDCVGHARDRYDRLLAVCYAD